MASERESKARHGLPRGEGGTLSSRGLSCDGSIQWIIQVRKNHGSGLIITELIIVYNVLMNELQQESDTKLASRPAPMDSTKVHVSNLRLRRVEFCVNQCIARMRGDKTAVASTVRAKDRRSSPPSREVRFSSVIPAHFCVGR
jgi:hypothetical protein